MNTTNCRDSNHLENLFANLQSLSFQDKFTDLRFVCANGETVNAHKLLFCSVSKQLKKMISDLPSGLDTVIINVPDIVRSKLSSIVEFLYTGVLKILPQEFVEYQQILTLLGIELDNLKPTTERQQSSHVLGQNSMMSNVLPVLSLPGQVMLPSYFGVQQRQNPPTAFIPAPQPNFLILPTLHAFTNQPTGVTPDKPTLSRPDVVNQNTKTSPNCVVVNSEQAYKLIKQTRVQSVVQRIQKNPEVSLIPKNSKVSNTLESQNSNRTYNENFVIDVEEDGNSMPCIVENVYSLQGESTKNTNAIVIDLEGEQLNNGSVETECITLDDEEEAAHVNKSGPNDLNTEQTNIANNSPGDGRIESIDPISSTVISNSGNKRKRGRPPKICSAVNEGDENQESTVVKGKVNVIKSKRKRVAKLKSKTPLSKTPTLNSCRRKHRPPTCFKTHDFSETEGDKAADTTTETEGDKAADTTTETEGDKAADTTTLMTEAKDKNVLADEPLSTSIIESKEQPSSNTSPYENREHLNGFINKRTTRISTS